MPAPLSPLARFLTFCLLLSPHAVSQSLVGTWTGPNTLGIAPSITAACPGLNLSSGTLTLNIESSSGSTYSGSAAITNLPQVDSDCVIEDTVSSDSGNVTGTASGANLTGTLNFDFGGLPLDGIMFSASISGNQMKGSFTNIAGTFTLTKAGACNPLAISGITDIGNVDPTKTFNSYVYMAQCGTPPYSWTAPSPFFGLSVHCAGAACVLSGTPLGPTAPNSNLFFQPLIVTDSTGATAKVTLSGLIQIPQKPPVMQSNSATDSTWKNAHYVFNFEDIIVGGIGIYSCTPLVAPAPASGLTFGTGNGSCMLGGLNAGTPGNYTFSVRVQDGSTPPQSATYTLNLTIKSTSTASASLQAPVIYNNGIVDVSGGEPVLTPGSVMILYGTNLSDQPYNPFGPLTTSLGNVQVTVNGQNAPLFYVGPGQINFQAPANPATYYPSGTACLQVQTATYNPINCPQASPVQITVFRNGISSATATVPFSLANPTVSQYQRVSGSLDPIILNGAGQLVSPSVPANGGDIVAMYGTGVGVPTCHAQTNVPAAGGCLSNSVPQITFPDYPVLNNSVDVQYAGLTPGGIGLGQYNVQLPPQFPSTASNSIRMRLGDPSSGQTFPLYINPGAAGPIVQAALLAGASGVVNGSCAMPSAVTGFTTASSQAWLYFDVTNTRTGDIGKVEFIRPDGQIYQTTSTAPISYTFECFSPSIQIGGAQAASYPGQWKVQVYWNGASTPLFTLPFYLSPITFSGQAVTSLAPQGTCTEPPSAASFRTASNTVYLYFSANVTSGDNLLAIWSAPDGTVGSTENWNPSSGNYCFTGGSLNVGSLSAAKLGSWLVSVFDNGTQLFSVPFTVSQ